MERLIREMEGKPPLPSHEESGDALRKKPKLVPQAEVPIAGVSGEATVLRCGGNVGSLLVFSEALGDRRRAGSRLRRRPGWTYRQIY